MEKELSNYIMIQSPQWFINNYHMLLTNSAMEEKAFLEVIIDHSEKIIQGINLELDYDKNDSDALLADMVKLADIIYESLYGYKLSTSINFFFSDPGLIYDECEKTYENTTDRDYDDEIEIIGIGIKKRCMLYGAIVRLKFVKTKIIPPTDSEGAGDTFIWKANKVETVELIKALIYSGAIEGTHKTVFSIFSNFLNIDLSSHDKTLQDIKLRIDAETKFIDKIRSSFKNELSKQEISKKNNHIR